LAVSSTTCWLVVDGDDTLRGFAGADSINGGAGNDVIEGGWLGRTLLAGGTSVPTSSPGTCSTLTVTGWWTFLPEDSLVIRGVELTADDIVAVRRSSVHHATRLLCF
jgi:Ca2+-binding RTX toxin-like protein